MRLYLKYNIEKACRVILMEQLEKIDFKYTLEGSGIVQFPTPVPMHQYNLLQRELHKYGIELVDNQKAILVHKIKVTIMSMLHKFDLPLVKISTYLANELNENYRTLSAVLTEVCHMSIESFIIIGKIEMVKQLLITENLSFTEISFRMNYSSVGYLSNQFKKITGFSPTDFQKVIQNRRYIN